MLTFALSALALAPLMDAHGDGPRTVSAIVAERDQVELPMENRKGYPMVRGEVNGRPGLFMLDTGAAYLAVLNSDYLRLPRGTRLTSGAVGSGQKIVVFRQGCVRSLSIAGGYTLDTLCNFRSVNWRFVADAIEPRFLGFIGYGLYRPYRVTFDFAARRVTLAQRNTPLEAGAVTAFRFSEADHQVPHVKLTAGAVALAGTMDTGNPGEIGLTRGDADALLAAGRLKASSGPRRQLRYILSTVSHDGAELDVSDVPVSISGEESRIVLGFRTLRHYRSTWDFGDRVVRLYPASGAAEAWPSPL